MSLTRSLTSSTALAFGAASLTSIGISYLNFIPWYGQSNSIGHTASDAHVDTDSYSDALMFTGGPTPWIDDPQSSVNTEWSVTFSRLASTTTLAERTSGVYGSTGQMGVASKLTGEDGLKTLQGSMGRGSARWLTTRTENVNSAISPGMTHWNNLMVMFHYAKKAADAEDLPLRIPALIFDHGEAAATNIDTESEYRDQMDELVAEVVHYAKPQIQDSTLSEIPIIIKQMSAPHFTGTGRGKPIMAAQLAAGLAASNSIYCAGPDYWTTKGDGAHRNSLGHRLWGELCGYVIQQLLAGVEWEPLHIESVSRTGTTITVTCAGGGASGLSIDTTTIASTASQGFTYSGANITDVSVSGLDITITIDADAGGTLAYAIPAAGAIGSPTSGCKGNIRSDASLFTANHDSSEVYAWLCHDEWVVA